MARQPKELATFNYSVISAPTLFEGLRITANLFPIFINCNGIAVNHKRPSASFASVRRYYDQAHTGSARMVVILIQRLPSFDLGRIKRKFIEAKEIVF